MQIYEKFDYDLKGVKGFESVERFFSSTVSFFFIYLQFVFLTRVYYI